MAVVKDSEVEGLRTTRIIPSEARFHPVADIFPPMSDPEFRELVEDIREFGQREAVWILPDGQVIDGWHRVKACAELGRSVDARVYRGEGDAVTAFVVSLNLKRRHLNESQRGMVAGRLATLKRGDNQFTEEDGSIDLTSQTEAAEIMNVSVPTVKRSVAVQRTGTPELVAAVDSGHVSVSAAAEVATLPEEEQREVVAPRALTSPLRACTGRSGFPSRHSSLALELVGKWLSPHHTDAASVVSPRSARTLYAGGGRPIQREGALPLPARWRFAGGKPEWPLQALRDRCRVGGSTRE